MRATIERRLTVSLAKQTFPIMTADPDTSSAPGQSAAAPIGVIGLGLLGTALAERLLDGGFPVSVYNRTREKAAPLLERGARWTDHPVAECQRVVVCLYTSGIVREVLRQFEEELRPGQIFIDATTGDPDETASLGQWLAEREAHYLESPIAASSEQTRRGEATALVAGPKQAFIDAVDLFDVLVAKAHYLGEWGNAAKTKLVNNLILGLNRAVLAEGLWLAENLNLDPAATLEVLKQSNSYSGVMDTKGAKMVSKDFAPQAKLSQHAKDVRIILAQIAARGQRLPLSELHHQLLLQAESAGLGELDNSAIAQVFSQLAACESSTS